MDIRSRIGSKWKLILASVLLVFVFFNIYDVNAALTLDGAFIKITMEPLQIQDPLIIEDEFGVDKFLVKSDGSIQFSDGSIQLTAAGGGIPTGFVGFFNMIVCPSGWSELTSARGRYLVGMPSAGTLGTQVGTALSNVESRSTGLHTHSVSDPGHRHYSGSYTDCNPNGGLWTMYTNTGCTAFPTSFATTGISIASAGGVAGTNAPYLQLLVCQKD